MIKVLITCHGNICRSPMAEFVFRDMAAKAGVEVEVASAATSAEEIGNPVYPPVRRLLLEHGLDPSGKTARQLRRSEYGDWDLIVGMDSANIRNMNRIFGGDPERKLIRLLDLTPTPGTLATSTPAGTTSPSAAAPCSSACEACDGRLFSLTRVGIGYRI
jgi:protein-tyrosine phosphatase